MLTPAIKGKSTPAFVLIVAVWAYIGLLGLFGMVYGAAQIAMGLQTRRLASWGLPSADAVGRSAR